MKVYVVLLHEQVWGNEYCMTEISGVFAKREDAEKLSDKLKSGFSFNWDTDAVEIQEHELQ